MDSVGDSSESLFKNHGSGWDQLISLNQSCKFGDGGSSVVDRNEVLNSHYQVMLEHQTHMVPKIPSFGSGSFSAMITPLGLPESAPGSSRIPVDEPDNSSPNVRRKRRASESHSPLGPNKELSSMETSDGSKERDGKEKTEQQSKREEPKENYLHMRAKRGQATNSHSLAERVRRERISERMRLLQELVPGCNKITGKAMMLDEIINYVQSLQHQVEFLSMKLSTVNPDPNMDFERLLSSKDILHGSGAGGLTVPPGLNISHLSPAMSQGNFMGGAPNIPQLYHPMPQMVWDGEFQSLLQMGFNPHTSTNNLGPNGR